MGCCKSKPRGNYHWVKTKINCCPKDAVEVDEFTDPTGGTTKVLVARHWHEGDLNLGKTLVPGRLDTRYGVCYIAWGGQEHKYTSGYEILTAPPGSVEWVPSSDGKAHPKAVVGGVDELGETLYIGRVTYDHPQSSSKIPGDEVSFHTMTLVGKIHPKYQCCFVPYRGHETAYSTYEILVQK